MTKKITRLWAISGIINNRILVQLVIWRHKVGHIIHIKIYYAAIHISVFYLSVTLVLVIIFTNKIELSENVIVQTINLVYESLQSVYILKSIYDRTFKVKPINSTIMSANHLPDSMNCVVRSPNVVNLRTETDERLSSTLCRLFVRTYHEKLLNVNKQVRNIPRLLCESV